MAITACHFDFYKHLLANGHLKQGGMILEIGQAEWYGDKDPFDLLREIYEIEDESRKARLEKQFQGIVTVENGGPQYLNQQLGSFYLAELFYRIYLQPECIASIDMHGTERATVHNLNNPIEDRRALTGAKFDLVINNGTIEHIFNIAEVFRSMHNQCKPGGVMLHDAPFTGWIDHGFYNIQPTLYYDLARVNGYKILAMWICDLATPSSWESIDSREHLHMLSKRKLLPENSILLVALKKTKDARGLNLQVIDARIGSFETPIQGVYSGEVSKEVVNAWHEMR